MGDPKATKEN